VEQIPLTIRLLSEGDERILELLAAEEQDFDMPFRASPRVAVSGQDAADYLADPHILHWVAEDEGRVIGHLLSYVERRRAGVPRQLLLYEIGVREGDRRRGVGEALVSAMRAWVETEQISCAWVWPTILERRRSMSVAGLSAARCSPCR
jgi:ribosomal protein S18 acetylase RimI-like enzyme